MALRDLQRMLTGDLVAGFHSLRARFKGSSRPGGRRRAGMPALHFSAPHNVITANGDSVARNAHIMNEMRGGTHNAGSTGSQRAEVIAGIKPLSWLI